MVCYGCSAEARQNKPEPFGPKAAVSNGSTRACNGAGTARCLSACIWVAGVLNEVQAKPVFEQEEQWKA